MFTRLFCTSPAKPTVLMVFLPFQLMIIFMDIIACILRVLYTFLFSIDTWNFTTLENFVDNLVSTNHPEWLPDES